LRRARPPGERTTGQFIRTRIAPNRHRAAAAIALCTAAADVRRSPAPPSQPPICCDAA